MQTIIQFKDLKTADLIKGATYKGGEANNLSSEPISKLLPVGNQSGIRFSGKSNNPKVVVLYTTLYDKDWPDSIENEIVTYYGDNKSPGKELHSLPGNQLLKSIFTNYHLSGEKIFPPIYLFSKGEVGFDRIFHGALKPGHKDISEMEDLVAIWKTKDGKRFQNYKAIFTLLPVDRIERKDFIKKI